MRKDKLKDRSRRETYHTYKPYEITMKNGFTPRNANVCQVREMFHPNRRKASGKIDVSHLLRRALQVLSSRDCMLKGKSQQEVLRHPEKKRDQQVKKCISTRRKLGGTTYKTRERKNSLEVVANTRWLEKGGKCTFQGKRESKGLERKKAQGIRPKRQHRKNRAESTERLRQRGADTRCTRNDLDLRRWDGPGKRA